MNDVKQLRCLESAAQGVYINHHSYLFDYQTNDVGNDWQADRSDSEVMEDALSKAIVRNENVLRLLIQTENE